MDQVTNSLGHLNALLPWVSLLAGLAGSLHCLGMCGGLVTASCSQSGDILRYQTGRLLGYMFLGLVGAILGKLVHFSGSPLLSLISATGIGLAFIYWGLERLLPKGTLTPSTAAPWRAVPGKFLGRIYGLLWKKLVFKNTTFTRSFFTGLVSIFLPCGLLYGVVISQAALVQTTHQYYQVFLAMIFFWMGTLPSMVFAPRVFHKLLKPLKDKVPKLFAVAMMIIGLTTISYRVIRYNEIQKHSDTALKKGAAPLCH